MSEEEMIRARDAFYSGLDKGDPCHWRDVGPDEIWETAWRAAWNLRQQVPDGYAVVPVGAIGKFTAAGRSINPIAVSTLVREGLAIMDAMKPEDVK